MVARPLCPHLSLSVCKFVQSHNKQSSHHRVAVLVMAQKVADKFGQRKWILTTRQLYFVLLSAYVSDTNKLARFIWAKIFVPKMFCQSALMSNMVIVLIVDVFICTDEQCTYLKSIMVHYIGYALVAFASHMNNYYEFDRPHTRGDEHRRYRMYYHTRDRCVVGGLERRHCSTSERIQLDSMVWG